MLGSLVYCIQVLLQDLVSFSSHQSLVLSVDTHVLGDEHFTCGVHVGALVNGCTDVVGLFDELNK